MRLSLSVNDRLPTRASLESEGWLAAHINLSQGIDGEQDRVWLNSIDRSHEPNTVHSAWEAVPLSVGDKIEIHVLPDGEADPPTEVTRTSESPKNLFADIENARQLLRAIKVCDTALMNVLELAAAEPENELKKIRLAIGSVVVELDRQLISPTLRRHPELLAYATENKLR